MIILKTGIVNIRSKNIMNRNHARQALNGKIYVVFFAALTILVHVLIQIFIADVYLHYALRFFMVYFVYW